MQIDVGGFFIVDNGRFQDNFMYCQGYRLNASPIKCDSKYNQEEKMFTGRQSFEFVEYKKKRLSQKLDIFWAMSEYLVPICVFDAYHKPQIDQLFNDKFCQICLFETKLSLVTA